MSYGTCRTIADIERVAAARERRVVYPKPNELQIDIDSAEAYAKHNDLLMLFVRDEPIKGVTISPSFQMNRYHVTVTLERDVDATERVLLQSLLGSDPIRELLSYRRIQAGSDPAAVSVFFERLEVCT